MSKYFFILAWVLMAITFFIESPHPHNLFSAVGYGLSLSVFFFGIVVAFLEAHIVG